MRSFSLHLRLGLILAATLSAAGCATVEDRQRLVAETIAPAAPEQLSATHRIFIATSRAQAQEPGVVFSGNRSPSPSFAFADISVPSLHQPGNVERSPSPRVADPKRYFAARRLGIYSGRESFAEVIRGQTAQHGGRVLVFVHGFNTSFGEAAYRMTQIVHDSGYVGVPVLFTWPSAARVVDYIYDHNSATAARDALEETLLLLARSGAQRIDIVAHSMGSWVTMEALRQLAIAGNRDLGGRLADVVLASPDIDVDVFKAQMRRYGVPDRKFFVLTSKNDRALDVSRLIAGNEPRVGGAIEAEELAEYGVTVVDITSLASPDGLRHAKFAENPLLVRLLGEGLMAEETDDLAESDLGRHLEALAQGIGQTVGSAAGLVITTPFEVLNAAARR